MFGHSWYNETTRRYTAVFGTLFNNITIRRVVDQTLGTTEPMKVPLSYGPAQKFLTRTQQDADLNMPTAIQLPRMSFEILSMAYDGSRNLPNLLRASRPNQSNNNTYDSVFSGAPWNIEFQLVVMAKYSEDGLKIIEQILPFFKPMFVPTVKILDQIDQNLDIPIVLNGVSVEDTYEGSFEDRRVITWTLSFTMKAYYFGPVTSGKVIKFATVNTYAALDATSPITVLTDQPGLTANGEPTTDISQTIPYLDINAQDDWAHIVRIEDFDG